MGRKPKAEWRFKGGFGGIPDYCYHITMRCNNRAFNLASRESREILLYTLNRAKQKYDFKIFGLCIMLNHTHYLIQPATVEELPKIMHWINWYSAMCLNRILKRTGHFWEKRYFCEGFPVTDSARALNTLRYIHANPKAAGMKFGFFYDFSNFGVYDQLTDDGLTEWHPAFLELGESSDECAKKYRGFCKRYRPRHKKQQPPSKWGRKLLGEIQLTGTGKRRTISPGHKKPPVSVGGFGGIIGIGAR